MLVGSTKSSMLGLCWSCEPPHIYITKYIYQYSSRKKFHWDSFRASSFQLHKFIQNKSMSSEPDITTIINVWYQLKPWIFLSSSLEYLIVHLMIVSIFSKDTAKTITFKLHMFLFLIYIISLFISWVAILMEVILWEI